MVTVESADVNSAMSAGVEKNGMSRLWLEREKQRCTPGVARATIRKRSKRTEPLNVVATSSPDTSSIVVSVAYFEDERMSRLDLNVKAVCSH